MPGTISHALPFIAPALIALFLLLGPRVIIGSRLSATNKLYRVTMPERSRYGDERLWRAVLAQEVGEWFLANAAGFVAALVTAFLVGGLEPMYALAPLFAYMITGAIFYRLLAAQFDLIGHTIETIYAGWDWHVLNEATRMKRDPKFARLGIDEIIRKMKRRRWIARIILAMVRRRVERL